jgi:hypothetical protein
VDRESAAREYHDRGWTPVPVGRRSKKPRGEGWQLRAITAAEIPSLFSGDGNIGLLTGGFSCGLTDVDLDCDEAVALAERFLPPTSMRSGRKSRPLSHRWYVTPDDAPASRTFTDIDKNKTMLVELRTDGHQTLVPPSVHPDGDPYCWDGQLDPLPVKGSDLNRMVGRFAAAVLLVRHWPRTAGVRHQIANALAGLLLRAGWTDDDASRFILLVATAAGDAEAHDRARDAIATARSIERGKNVTGAPTLASLLDPKIVEKVRDWLGLTLLIAFTASTAYSVSPEISWPAPVADAAFIGLAGKFVEIVEPHTESDPAALLVQFLVAFGSCVGRGPHFKVESDEHHGNLFAAVVGATSKGRKGTSWGNVRRVFFDLDRNWTQGRIVNGLSSGEGVIWHVRDEIRRTDPIKVKGRVIDYEEVIADPGVDDKRLLVTESELASVLRVIGREGNTLSPTVRSAWDTGRLQILTKNSPAKATGAHVSIIGHITKDELVRELDRTEAANGFANRFLWIAARRSKQLPNGGTLEDSNFYYLNEDLRLAIADARKISRLTRDDDASALWESVYGVLSDGKPGLFGAVVSRAEAQVTRIALLYALLDTSAVIRQVHLEAALAVWNYAEASARYIFGDSLGDPIADTVLKALRDNREGLTREDIRNLFGRNQPAERIARALRSLADQGLARFEMEKTEGRPAERWIAGMGNAINAVNAISPPADDPYRVNRVDGVPAWQKKTEADPARPDPSDDDEVAL